MNLGSTGKIRDMKDFHKAERWIYRNARPLEAALWKVHFHGALKEGALSCLKAFQNEDGGFGHGLEPDFWTPQSSPMATWAAGEILEDLEVEKDHPMIRHLVKYLVNTGQVSPGIWPSSLPENNEYPHAPHWTYREGVQDNWMFNPSIQLSAYLIHWGMEENERELGWESLLHGMNYLKEKTELDFHEVHNFQKMIKLLRSYKEEFTKKMPISYEESERKIDHLRKKCIDQNWQGWGDGYKALPLDFITDPIDTLYFRFEELIDKNIEHYRQTTDHDGVWDISWSWDRYDQEFSIARQQWKGILALKRYRIMEKFI